MNIVFLDIDGVIKPYASHMEYGKADPEVIKMLSDKYHVDYSKYNIYDVLNAYYHWHKDALKNLKYILDETNSKIIVTSDWRNPNKPDKMQNLFRLHDMADYWYQDNPVCKNETRESEVRALEIQKSLSKYPIDNFVIIDDMYGPDMYYPKNFVKTYNYLKQEDAERAVKILKKLKF